MSSVNKTLFLRDSTIIHYLFFFYYDDKDFEIKYEGVQLQ